MAREGQFLKLPGGWFGKVEGEGDHATLKLYRTFNNQADGRVLEEIRLEKSDTHDLYAFLAEEGMVYLTAAAAPKDDGANHVSSGTFGDGGKATTNTPAASPTTGKKAVAGKATKAAAAKTTGKKAANK